MIKGNLGLENILEALPKKVKTSIEGFREEYFKDVMYLKMKASYVMALMDAGLIDDRARMELFSYMNTPDTAKKGGTA